MTRKAFYNNDDKENKKDDDDKIKNGIHNYKGIWQ